MPLTPFQKNLRDKILSQGPLSLLEVMGLSNAYYYAQKEVFGREGDFITAPEISQIFGECVAFWVVDQCQKAGVYNPTLFEMGPGRGTLMRDIVRILSKTKIKPDIHFLETSPKLRELQKEHIPELCSWHDDLRDIPKKFTLFLANEFFDALPIQQKEGDVEVCVDYVNDAFVFLRKSGEVTETSPVSMDISKNMAAHLSSYGGAALMIDYGDYTEGERIGETLQAVKHHVYVDPLKHLGDADLTAHVDFKLLSKAFLKKGLRGNFMAQRDFLKAYGFDLRLQKLMEQSLSHDQRQDIQNRAHRLIDPKQMGELFKVLEISP